jgi:nicotinamidase-related amidase
MLDACHALKIPMLVTEQYSKGLGSTLPYLQQKLGKNYKPIEKLEFSCYRNHEFRLTLSQLDKKCIIIAGIEAHVCILQSVLDFISAGYSVHVIADAICSRYKGDWKNSLQFMRSAGAVITTTETVVFQLLQQAGTTEFKQIAPLFKNRESG